MRPIQNYLLSKLKNKIQTTGNNNEIRSHVRLSRPTTVLENDLYLEKLPLGINNCDDCSIAVAHETPSRRNSRIDIMYIENGVAKWCVSPTKYPMEEHVFVDTGFMESATSCSICYDSNTKLTRDGIVEMLTYGDPWLFWTDPLGELWCQNGMDQTTRISLATSGVNDVSAIRGLFNKNKEYDYGLIVFFILGGSIYYRQLINNVWTDAVSINFGPSATYVEISATRSWDTRIFLQARTSSGSIYEMVTQQQGFAKNDLGENIGTIVSGISMTEKIQEIITMPPVYQKENMGYIQDDIVPNVGFSDEPSVIRLTSIKNVSVNGNYGKRIDIEMTDKSSVHVACWVEAFKHYLLTDSRGFVYAPYKVVYDEFKSSKASLYFTNFNSAVGSCVLTMGSGFLKTVNGVIIESSSITFTPIGLVPPEYPGPNPIAVDNSSDGNTLVITFDKRVYTSDDNFNISKFEVYTIKPEYQDPRLDPIKQRRVPIDVVVSDRTVTLYFKDMSTDNLRNFNNCQTVVSYRGGNLSGNENEDIVPAFDFDFTPTDMAPANNQWTGVSLSVNSNINMNQQATDIITLPPTYQTENAGLISSSVIIANITITDVGDV